MISKTKEIDGIQFTVTTFPAVEAFKLQPYLMKKFGPAIGQALGTLKDGLPTSGVIGDIKLDGAVLSQAIEKLMDQLDETEFIDLLKRILSRTTAQIKNGAKIITAAFTEEHFDQSLDTVFTGKLFSVYPLLLFVLEVNYPDFFGKLAQGIGKNLRKMVTSEPEEKNSMSESETSET